MPPRQRGPIGFRLGMPRRSILAADGVPSTSRAARSIGPLGAYEGRSGLGIDPQFEPRVNRLELPEGSPMDWFPSREVSEAIDDLELLRKHFPAGWADEAGSKRAYVTKGADGRVTYRADAYLKHRSAFFGSTSQYRAYLDQCRAELDADNGALRTQIEPPTGWRGGRPQWRQAQDIFYAWVRKAYEGVVGPEKDIPAIIKARMTPELIAAVAQVKIDFGEDFTAGGFNPRPKKKGGNFRLGTISDHALGIAVDVRDRQNLQLEGPEWRAILSITGMSLDEPRRKQLWRQQPEVLHQEIAAIDRAFASTFQTLMAQHKTGAALRAADARFKDIQLVNFGHIERNKGHFFDLPLDLVKAFHKSKFLWGATFPTVDLHHFEL